MVHQPFLLVVIVFFDRMNKLSIQFQCDSVVVFAVRQGLCDGHVSFSI